MSLGPVDEHGGGEVMHDGMIPDGTIIHEGPIETIPVPTTPYTGPAEELPQPGPRRGSGVEPQSLPLSEQHAACDRHCGLQKREVRLANGRQQAEGRDQERHGLVQAVEVAHARRERRWRREWPAVDSAGVRKLQELEMA